MTEVQGLSMTLQEAIDAGEIPRPGLMSFNSWQQWRRDAGRRVTGSAGTGSREEATLWRRTMERPYGSEWQEDLALQNRPEQEEGAGGAGADSLPGGLRAGPAPAAGAAP